MNIQMTMKTRGVSKGQWVAVISTNDNHRTSCREEDWHTSTPCFVNARVLLPSYLGRKRFMLLTFPYHSSSLKTVRVGIQTGIRRQGLMQSLWRSAAYSLASHGLVSLLAYRVQHHQPRDDTQPWASWQYYQATIKQENVPRPCLQTNLVCVGCFLNWDFPLQNDGHNIVSH